MQIASNVLTHTIHGLHVAMDNKQELLLLHHLLVVQELLPYLNLALEQRALNVSLTINVF
jgi:hypothetical protein